MRWFLAKLHGRPSSYLLHHWVCGIRTLLGLVTECLSIGGGGGSDPGPPGRPQQFPPGLTLRPPGAQLAPRGMKAKFYTVRVPAPPAPPPLFAFPAAPVA